VPHVPRLALVGLLAGVVVLAGGCSGPAPSEVPEPASSAPATVAPSASDPATPDPGASPSTDPTAPAEPQPSEPQPYESEPDVEPSRPIETAPPKKLDEPTRTAGAKVSLVSVRTATIKATAPGDRSGPGVLVRLKLENTTGRTLDTSFTQVGLADQAGAPATLVDGPPTKALGASVRSGRSAQGTYAFVMDDASAGPVTVSVYVTSGQPVVTFRGRAS
jgi:hypothetical protein